MAWSTRRKRRARTRAAQLGAERLEARLVLSARSLLFPQAGDGPGQVTDTYVDYAYPTTAYAAAESLDIDQSSGLAQRQQSLIRFADLFGSGAGQIRPDDTIVSATLDLESEGFGGGGVKAYRMLKAWSDTVTWASLGDGIQWDGVEAVATPDATVNSFSSWSSVSIDLTSSLRAWQAAPASNFGWMLTSTTSTKGRFASSESPDVQSRPALTVVVDRAAALVSVSAVDPLAFEGTSPGAFVISRTDTVGDLVVPYMLGGTATAGTDYRSLPGSVTISAGSRSAIVTVVPVEDGVAESPESVTLQITSSATIETDLATASITIRDAFAGTGGLVVPLDETFTLQSLPGARHTIYLDFLGSNQVWGSWNSGRPIDTPAYDLDGDPSTFSDAELLAIQLCWAEMAEDFRAFEVNVTTVLPEPGQLAKTAASDLEWGIRVIFGKSTNWDLGAGGKAYLGSFSDDFDNPAWVKGASGVIASHEVGHALGLEHDGDPGDEYYPGHGSGETFWGPLMGGTYEGLSQWDRGTYPGADNQEDDLLIITTQNGFGYRADDHADLSVNASELVTFGDATGRWYAEGNIERNTDVDWFRFTVGAGSFEITVDPLATIGNLDVRADLFDAAGTLIATSNPVNELSASFTESLSAGTYFVRVDGDGNPDPTSPGYDDYGSLGFYTVRVGPAASTVSFQQGVDGYAGTSDTTISRDFASSSRANSTTLFVDGKYSRYPAATLLRFADLFGDGTGQVPPGALVQSATLELNFEDPGDAFTVHTVLRDWAETDTYTSLVDGLAADGVEAAITPVAASADYVEGWSSIDITAAVTAWLAAPSSNYGLLFQPGAGSTNGNDIASSESTTPPRLTIRYLPSDVPDDGIDDPTTGSVAVTGSPLEGGQLQAVATLTDPDGPLTLAYRWQIAASDTPVDSPNWTDIPGANQRQLNLSSSQDQIGRVVRVVVTATDPSGSGTTFVSAATAPIENVNDLPTWSAVAIGGIGRVGERLTLDLAGLTDADGLGAVSIQWRRDGVAIAGQTGSSYDIVAADAGRQIAAFLSFTDGFGMVESFQTASVNVEGSNEPGPVSSVLAAEQYFIYELNRARHDPVAYQIERGVSVNLASVTPRPPLAVNAELSDASGFKSGDMAARNYFSHTAPGLNPGDPSETPNELARRFGYDLPETVQVGGTTYSLPAVGNMIESIAAGYATADGALKGLIESTGHRNHLLGITAHNQVAREVGIGYGFNSSAQYQDYWAVLIAPSNEPLTFLTGVVFADGDADTRFDAAEGIGSVTVTATGPAGTFTTSSLTAGGWTLAVPAGDYIVTASGGGFSGTGSVAVTVGTDNVAVDFISGSRSGWINFEQFVNSAPTLEASPQSLPPVVTSNASPSGVSASELLGAAFADADPLTSPGIAITAATAGTASGAWSYSIDGGASWVPFGMPSAGAALLLRGPDLVRFVPTPGSTPGAASISYRAWDQTTGLAGGTADALAAGGSTAFSTATATATIATIAVNTAPVLAASGGGNLASVLEDATNPAGTTVAVIVGSSLSDVDPGTPPGIAITGSTGQTDGVWEYSMDGGATWQAVGTALEASALPLQASHQVRFTPAADFNGTATISYRGWDQSTGTAGTRVDLSGAGAVGGSTAFSAASRTASVTVTPQNDAPEYLPGRSALRLRPVDADDGFDFIGTTIADLLGNAVFDVDVAAKPGIALIGLGDGGSWYWNTGGSSWSGGDVAPQWATLLRSTDRLGYSPRSGFSGEVTFTFRLWDQSTGTAGWNKANLSNPNLSTGGTTAFGTDILTGRLFVGAADAAPTASFGTPARAGDGQAITSIPITFSEAVDGLDIDDVTLSRDGSPVSLAGALLTGSGTSFVLRDLSEATARIGSYTLTLAASGSGIADSTGNRLAANTTALFTVVTEGEPTDVNEAPTGVGLTGTTPSLAENTSTAGRIKVAEIVITDDALGTNSITLGGADSGSFEVDGLELFLKSGVSLDFETKQSYAVTVSVADPSLADSTPVTAGFTLTVTDVNDVAPVFTSGTTGSVAESAPTSTAIYTAATTDADGSVANRAVTYSIKPGVGDAALVQIDATTGVVTLLTTADFEAKASYAFTVVATNAGTGATLVTEQAVTVTVSDVNEAPTAVSLSPAARSLADTTSTSEPLKLADIAVTDDGLGTNSLALSGPDATSFEIIGTELYLRAGVVLDGLSKAAYSVTVQARDATLPGGPRSAVFSLSVTAGGIQVADGQTTTDSTSRSGEYRLIKRGLGTLILDQANTHSGGTIVEAGEVIVRNPLAFGSGVLVVQAGAKLTLDIGTRRASLAAVTVAGTGTLDLGSGSVALAAGSYDLAALRGLIVSGRNNGAWTGTGIVSRSVRGVPFREVGYRVLPDGSAIVGFSAVGDANMDGFVNVQDLIALNAAGKYGSVASTTNWWEGDFNYDGLGNINDLIALLSSGLYGRNSYLPLNSATAGVSATAEAPALTEASALSAVPPGVTLTGYAAPESQPEPVLVATTAATARAPEPRRIDRFTWAAIANQGEAERPADRKVAFWRMAGR